MLQFGRLHAALRDRYRPAQTVVRQKLFGSLRDLQRTAAFLREFFVSIRAIVDEEDKFRFGQKYFPLPPPLLPSPHISLVVESLWNNYFIGTSFPNNLQQMRFAFALICWISKDSFGYSTSEFNCTKTFLSRSEVIISQVWLGFTHHQHSIFRVEHTKL